MALIKDHKTDSLSNRTRRPLWRLLISVLAISFLLLGSIFGWAYSRTGSASLILRFLNGEQLLVDPMTVSLGTLEKGTKPEFRIRVVNATTSDVTLVGAQRSCSCITTEEFPLSIPQGHSRELKLNLNVARRSGEIEESVKFYTDYGGLQAFQVEVRAVAR